MLFQNLFIAEVSCPRNSTSIRFNVRLLWDEFWTKKHMTGKCLFGKTEIALWIMICYTYIQWYELNSAKNPQRKRWLRNYSRMWAEFCAQSEHYFREYPFCVIENLYAKSCWCGLAMRQTFVWRHESYRPMKESSEF